MSARFLELKTPKTVQVLAPAQKERGVDTETLPLPGIVDIEDTRVYFWEEI